MSTTVEKMTSNKVKLTFEVDGATFEAAVQKAYVKNRGRINVPGFRKGKAPRKVIENLYGEGVFYDDAFEDIFPDVYRAAIDEHKLQPVDRPSVDIQEIGAGKNLVFTAEVFVRPDVTLGQYKGLEVKKDVHEVTDEEVDAQVNQAREKQAREIDVDDRAVENGDIVNLNYAGTVNGVAFEGGTAENQTLTIGSGMFIPGFEEQMIGMCICEERDLSVKFPEEYHAAELAGKDAVFHVKVNSIKTRELPEADDEFAKDVSEFDTLADYKADIRAKLQKEADDRAEVAFENAIVDAAVANATLDVPEAMIESQIDNMLQDFKMRLAYQGLKFEDFIKYTGQTEEAVRAQYKEEAERRVKGELVLEAIKNAEGIEASEEEIDAEIAKYAEQIKRDVEEVKKDLAAADKSYFADSVTVRKTIDLLKETAAK